MNNQQTIGSIVANDYRTADVFSKWGIDFCCKGGRSIDEVCRQKNIDQGLLIADLAKVVDTPSLPGDENIKAWTAAQLSLYIESHHHQYVRDATPVLRAYLKKINSVHGERHPELNEIYMLFEECATELLQHMIKEENGFFPAIRRMEDAVINGDMLDKPFFFGSFSNPIHAMQEDHEVEGERFARIAELSNNYTPPEDACNTYKVAFSKLREFESDLHRHIHLENNILFHRAMELERKLETNTVQTCQLSAQTA